ncbi:hypothetical protein SETIT_5G406100v2 [Setaria italica]|uniref:KIB1-4 beta-propeller domain-containing protein n=2 Tax=Setaria TaxID=4554 RepID=A0A368RE40_SETIT|nr:hypothetical protein SETIT_5G406100v2 [Setaria italica]
MDPKAVSSLPVRQRQRAAYHRKEEEAATKAKSTVEESTDAAGGRSPLGTLPVLVCDHGLNPNNRQTAFAIGDQSLHTSVVPELAGNHYHVTPHGWALLVAPGPSPRTRLWDPRSGQSVSLPAMEREPPEDWECCLSDAPTTSPSCVVLVLHMKEPKFLYCRVGGSHWSAHEYDVGDVKLPPSYAPPRKIVIQDAVGGRFYFNTGKLGVIDFSPAAMPELSFIDYPPPEFPMGSNCRREYMLESRGELFSVYICLKEFTPEIRCASTRSIRLEQLGQ